MVRKMSQKPRVILVDDCEDSLSSYSDILEDDFDVQVFTKPDAAIKVITDQSTDLVVLDLHMPELNGFEVYKCFEPSIWRLNHLFNQRS